jgi:hypothetical protein
MTPIDAKAAIKAHLFDTAAHESAHVIAHIICKSPFEYVRVSSILDAPLGESQILSNGRIAIPLGEVVPVSGTSDGADELRNEGIISLSAVAYEETKHPNCSLEDLTQMDAVCDDYEQAIDDAKYIEGISEESAKKLVDNEWLPAARKLVKDYWNDIMRLAEVLHIRRKMTQDECIAAISRSDEVI